MSVSVLRGLWKRCFPGTRARELSTHVALTAWLGLKAEAISARTRANLSRAQSGTRSRGSAARRSVGRQPRVDRAVLDAARKNGVENFSHIEVQGVWREKERWWGCCSGRKIFFRELAIVAAGCFSRKYRGSRHVSPVRPAKGQMVSLRSERTKIERVLWSTKFILVPEMTTILAVLPRVRRDLDKKITRAHWRKY